MRNVHLDFNNNVVVKLDSGAIEIVYGKIVPEQCHAWKIYKIDFCVDLFYDNATTIRKKIDEQLACLLDWKKVSDLIKEYLKDNKIKLTDIEYKPMLSLLELVGIAIIDNNGLITFEQDYKFINDVSIDSDQELSIIDINPIKTKSEENV